MSLQDLTSVGAVLVSQGAEARTYRYKLNGLECIVKERFKKVYRHPILDGKITTKRVLMEARAINKCRKLKINAPTLYLVDTNESRIYMEWIDGITVKQYLYNHDSLKLKLKENNKNVESNNNNNNQNNNNNVENNNNTIDEEEEKVKQICINIGKEIGRMHDSGLIHGDLTTSNMMLTNKVAQSGVGDGDLVFIDFGLSYISAANLEDRSVDLYVLERAFISTHPNSEYLFNLVLQGYQAGSTKATQTLNKLSQVRLRGRKKLAFG